MCPALSWQAAIAKVSSQSCAHLAKTHVGRSVCSMCCDPVWITIPVPPACQPGLGVLLL
jgi:hypothetical protein